MQINWQEAKNLPVYTVSGSKLGNLSSLVFDINTNVILQYEVRSRLIGGRTFLISPVQIVEWRKDKIIVEDNFLKEIMPVSLAGENN